MIQLTRYFRILFLTEISRENLKQFTEDHIQRLTINNPGGIFTAILAAITTAYTSYFGDMSDVKIAEASLKAQTAGMKDSLDALRKFIQDAHGLITYTFRNTPSIILQFYPRGLSKYDNMDLGSVELLANQFLTAANANSGSLPAGFNTDFNTLLTTFISNRNSQLSQKGTLSNERSEISGTQEALCLQLTKDLLTIALQYTGDETKAHAYFDQSIIDPDHAAKVLKEVTLNIAAHETVNIEITGFVMEPEYLIIATNPATSSVAAISFGPNATTLANAKTINAGSTYSASAAGTEFSATNTFLNLRSETDDPVSGLVVKIMKP